MRQFWTFPFRLLAKASSHLSTQTEVEEKLNEQYAGRQWEVETYRGDAVTVVVYSIHARPRVNFSGFPEPEMFHADGFRDDPTRGERIKASILDEWMTTVRFDVVDHDPECLRPAGLDLCFSSFLSSSVLALEKPEMGTRMVWITDEPEMYSDKLETKIRYNGSIASYKEALDKAIENLAHIQQNMDRFAFHYLINLYSQTDNEWRSEERARKVSAYLLGQDGEIDLDHVEPFVEKVLEEGLSDEESSDQPSPLDGTT